MYPPGTVTRTFFAARRNPAPDPPPTSPNAPAINPRSCTTYVCNVVRALRGGQPPHNSSTKEDTNTTRSARNANNASTCLGFGADGATDLPFTRTSNTPNTSISTLFPPKSPHPNQTPHEYKTTPKLCQHQTTPDPTRAHNCTANTRARPLSSKHQPTTPPKPQPGRATDPTHHGKNLCQQTAECPTGPPAGTETARLQPSSRVFAGGRWTVSFSRPSQALRAGKNAQTIPTGWS